MKKANYELGNVDDLSKKYAGSFSAPPRSVREKVKAGQMVKLSFTIPTKRLQELGGERMWVSVQKKSRTGIYTGKLANCPVLVDGLRMGDLVSFGPENIYDILGPPE